MAKEIKINDKFAPLYSDKTHTRYYVVTGGRASGKSFAVNLSLCLKLQKPKHRILFARYTMTSAERSIIPEFLEKIEMLGTQKQHAISAKEIVNLETSSTILFSGLKTSSGNQTAALKSLTGLTGFVLDEAEELVDETLFRKIDRSVRSKNQPNFVIIIMNPTSKDHWVYKRFFEQPNVAPGFNGVKHNVTYIHTTFEDNRENLPDDYIEDIMRDKIFSPKVYEHEILGGWKEKAEGVILTDWDVKPYQKLENHVYGQDFGFSEDPTVLIEMSCDVNRREIWVRECYRRKGLSTREVAKLNISYAGSSLIACDVDPRLVHELKTYGCNMKQVKKKDKHLSSSIALLQDFTIHVDPESKELIYEFNHWAWHKLRQNTPAHGNDHGPDAMRYALPLVYTRRNSGKYHLRY